MLNFFGKISFMSSKEAIIGIKSEAKKQPLTSSQTSMLNVLSYCHLLRLIDDSAKNYSLWKVSKSDSRTDAADQEEIKIRAKTALEDLCDAHNNHSFEAFKKDWGDEAETYQGLYNRISEKNSAEESAISERVSKFRIVDKLKTAFSVSKMIPHLSEEQRSRLFQMAGYDEKEALDICKKLAISMGFTVVEYGAFFVGTYSAAGLAAASPFFEEVNDTTRNIIALSYAAKYSGAILNTLQSVRLLKEKSINNSPNIVTTGTYYLLDKFLHNRERIRDLGTVAATLAEPVLQDIFWTSTFVFPAVGSSIVTARNVSGAGLNLAESGIKEVWLRVQKAKTKTDSPK